VSWRSTGVAEETLRPGGLREVTLGSVSILIVRVGTEVRAVDPYCPHAGGVLAEGLLDGPHLICPVHAAVFNALSGAVEADPFGIVPPEGGVDPLTEYPVRVVEGTIEVDLP
jgi:nitrite reductase/ring-hydroxylating ferredoxin subunit